MHGMAGEMEGEIGGSCMLGKNCAWLFGKVVVVVVVVAVVIVVAVVKWLFQLVVENVGCCCCCFCWIMADYHACLPGKEGEERKEDGQG